MEGTVSARTLRQEDLGCGRDRKAGTVAGAEWAGGEVSKEAGVSLAGPVDPERSLDFTLECAGPEGNGGPRGCHAGETWPDENLAVTDCGAQGPMTMQGLLFKT